jgi:hypothetical protein
MPAAFELLRRHSRNNDLRVASTGQVRSPARCDRHGHEPAAPRRMRSRLAGPAGDADLRQLDRVRRFAEQLARGAT